MSQSQPTYGATLGTYLRRSVFYAFGLCADIQGGGKVQETARAFWKAALRSMSGVVSGIGSDLSVPNIVPVAAQDYDIVLNEPTGDYTGRMYILTDRDGTLVDSRIGFDRLPLNAVINGALRCANQGNKANCNLLAKTESNVVSSEPNQTETLALSGSKALTGTLGVPKTPVFFTIAANPVTD